jgi:soluble lytic murein transglycosylase-like protein
VTRGGWLAVVAGAVGAGLLVASSKGPAWLVRILPQSGKPYAGALSRAAAKWDVDVVLLAAVIEQESMHGELLKPKGPGGLGDKGHGHGVGQIDNRTWGAWLRSARWWDYEVNATKAAEILAGELRTFGGNVRQGVSAYNAGAGAVRKAVLTGRDPGAVTTHDKQGVSYPDNVLRRFERMQLLKRRAA